MTDIKRIIEYMRIFAPEEYQDDWDNSGIQIYREGETEKVIVTMDLTDRVVDRAIEVGAKLIITHHPLFFEEIKKIDETTYKGKNIIKLIKNDISVYSAHTSLDVAEKGVNDALREAIGLKKVGIFARSDHSTIGYVLENTIGDGLYYKLEKMGATFYGVKRDVKKLAIVGGSGMSFFDEVIEKDLEMFVTGDVKHHDAQKAYENNICLVDLTHYGSEKFVLPKLKDFLEAKFDIEVEIVDTDFKLF